MKVLAFGGPVLAVVLFAVLAASISAETGTDLAAGPPATVGTTIPVDRTTTTTMPPVPGSSRELPAPLGTEVTLMRGWTVKVTGVELNANARLQREGRQNRPDAGTQFVAVAVTVHNGDLKPGALAANASVGLLTGAGIRLADSAVTSPTRLDRSRDVPPNGTVSGQLVFEVPVAEVPVVVFVAEPLPPDPDGPRFLAIR